MATMAIAKRHKRNARADVLAKAQFEKEKEIEAWFDGYDRDHSNSLDRKEMADLLTAIKRESSNDPSASPVEDSVLDLVFRKYAFAVGPREGQIGREKVLNAVKAFKSYISQELAYKELFLKCARTETARDAAFESFRGLYQLSCAQPRTPPAAFTTVVHRGTSGTPSTCKI